MCNHCALHERIHDDLSLASIPSLLLTRRCCWREICRARAYAKAISLEAWRGLCRRRGYVWADAARRF